MTDWKRIAMGPACLILLVSVLTSACDSDSSTAMLDEPIVDNQTVTEPPVVTETPPVAVIETPEPTPVQLTYPEGPYGKRYLDTIADMSFYDPWSGLTYKYSDYYEDEQVKVILISSAAGWCTACQYEAWDLAQVYDKYQADGLEVFYTLYENFQPGDQIWREDSTAQEIDDDFTFMNLFKNGMENGPMGLPKTTINYPMLVDIGANLRSYSVRGATPTTIIIRTSDMKILYLTDGYAQGSIDHQIKTVLYSSPSL